MWDKSELRAPVLVMVLVLGSWVIVLVLVYRMAYSQKDDYLYTWFVGMYLLY